MRQGVGTAAAGSMRRARTRRHIRDGAAIQSTGIAVADPYKVSLPLDAARRKGAAIFSTHAPAVSRHRLTNAHTRGTYPCGIRGHCHWLRDPDLPLLGFRCCTPTLWPQRLSPSPWRRIGPSHDAWTRIARITTHDGVRRPAPTGRRRSPSRPERARPGLLQGIDGGSHLLSAPASLERDVRLPGKVCSLQRRKDCCLWVPRRYPRHLFALGYGGNCMTFSFLAAGFIRERLMGRRSDDQLFSFGRARG